MWKQQKKARFGYMTSPHTPSASRSRSRPSGSLAPWANVFACSLVLATEKKRRATGSPTLRHATPSRGSVRGPRAPRGGGGRGRPPGGGLPPRGGGGGGGRGAAGPARRAAREGA